MIIHMCKLQLVTLDGQFDCLLEGLQSLRHLHLEAVPLGEPSSNGRLHRMQLTVADHARRQVLAETRRNVEELQVLLGSLAEPAEEERESWKSRSPEELRDAAAEILHHVRSNRRRRRNLEQDRRILERYMRVGHPVRRIDPLEERADVLLFTFPSEERMVARALAQRLRALAMEPLRLRFFTVTGRRAAAVVCPAERAEEVRDAAWRCGTLEFKLPLAYRAERLTESLRRVQADLDGMPQRLAELDCELDRLRSQAGHYAAALDHFCADEVERLEVKSRFLEGTLLRVLHAFVPVDRRDEVIRRAFELTSGRLSVEDLPLGPRLEEVPVVLSNPAFARPFEILLRVFPPPTYGTIDPTVINAVGVPLFFGLIVGDVAYGLIILAAAIWLRHRYRQREAIRAAGTIAMYCAASAVFFGLLYGELFGGLGTYLGLRPVLHREDPQQLVLLLKLVVCLGAAHVAMGLLLGVFSARRILDRHAFWERLGQLLCLAGLLLAAAGVTGVGHGSLAGAAGLFLAGVVVLLRGAGLVGLIEVFSLISNILSYSRLMALGVASVVLAMVANRLFAELNYGLVGLMAASVLHAMNVLITMFSPTIHTLRLHYVEFFTKFYRPGGRTFTPFGSRVES